MVKNLLLSAVNRGDLRRLNYSKTVFGRGAPPLTPQRELITLSQTPELMRMGILPPHSPPLSPRDPRAPRSPSELVPPLNAPAHQGVKLTTVISRLNHCVERLLHYHCTLSLSIILQRRLLSCVEWTVSWCPSETVHCPVVDAIE